MQDRYAGDIGDYGKFALLRAIQDEGLTVGLNWYLTEQDERELSLHDGGYPIPENLFEYNRELAEKLTAIFNDEETRSVATLERAALIDSDAYFSEPVPVRGRAEWQKRAAAALSSVNVVFLDPDNGFLPPSVKESSCRSVKYAFYEEAAAFVKGGKSVVVYNHRCRKKPELYFGEFYERFSVTEGLRGRKTLVITFSRRSVRDYFVFCANEEQGRALENALRKLAQGALGVKGKPLCNEHFTLLSGK